MSKSLVIVESPAKAKTISKYLGKDFTVEASVGHIKDLPKNKIGVDLDDGSFAPELIVIPGKEKVVDRLKKLAKAANVVYLAPDPDREGEAIAAHLEEDCAGFPRAIRSVGSPLMRLRPRRCRPPLNTHETWIAIWWMRNRRAGCSIASWVIRFHLCCGTRCAAAYLRAVCKP